MKIYKKNGIHYADYEDGSEPIKCDNSRQMWGRVFEAREVEKTLGHKVSSVTSGVERLVGPVKKVVKITIGEAVRI